MKPDDTTPTNDTDEDVIRSGPLPFADTPAADQKPADTSTISTTKDYLKDLPTESAGLPDEGEASPPPLPPVSGPELPSSEEVESYESKASGPAMADDTVEDVPETKPEDIKLETGKKKGRGKVIGAVLALIALVIGGGFTVIGARNYLQTGEVSFDIRQRAGSTACGAGVCNDDFSFGQDCNSSFVTCVDRNRQACQDHGGIKSGGGPITCAAGGPAQVQPPQPPATGGSSSICYSGSPTASMCQGKAVGSISSPGFQCRASGAGSTGGQPWCGNYPTTACTADGQSVQPGVSCCSGQTYMSGGVTYCGARASTASGTPTPTTPAAIQGCIRDGLNGTDQTCCSGRAVYTICTPAGTATAAPTTATGKLVCNGSLSASACKTVAVDNSCIGFNGTCRQTTTETLNGQLVANCACVANAPTAAGGAGTGGACAQGGQSCETASCCSGLVCQGVSGQRKCQDPAAPGGYAQCALNAVCGGNQGYLGFKCAQLDGNGQCRQNDQTFNSFAEAAAYAGSCGQVDTVWVNGSCNRNLCGDFTIFSIGCGGGQPPAVTTQPPAVTTAAPAGMCVATKLYAQVNNTWTAMTPAQIAATVRPGDTIRISTSGSGRVFTSGRFRVKVDDAVFGSYISSNVKNELGEYYINYPIPSAGTFMVEAQVL